jgi:hypothetical protein
MANSCQRSVGGKVPEISPKTLNICALGETFRAATIPFKTMKT